MWSGGRSLRLIAVAGGLVGLLGTASGQTPLCNGQHPGNPELISGAASCFYNEVNGGQTFIRLNANSIIRWDTLELRHPGSNLDFEWNGPAPQDAAVLNRVEGVPFRGQVGDEIVMGTVSFNQGNLIISNPNSGLTVIGTVQARSVLMATHDLDPGNESQLLLGQSADLTGSTKGLIISGGRVIATTGDVVLAGQTVANIGGASNQDNASEILALGSAGSVRIFGGENFRLLPDNVPQGASRIQRLPGGGNGGVLNSKTIRAERTIEFVSEQDTRNNGFLQANGIGGRVMMRVDQGGTLVNEADGLISADNVFPIPLPGPGQVVHPDEGDSPSPVSTGLSRVPVVGSPGSKTSSKRVVLRSSAPVTGSASAQRQRANRTRGGTSSSSPALSGSNTRGNSIASASSFFKLRGRLKAKKK